jgi:hypothetical protein
LSVFFLLGRARAFGLFSFLLFPMPHSPQNVLNSITNSYPICFAYSFPLFTDKVMDQGRRDAIFQQKLLCQRSFKVFVFLGVNGSLQNKELNLGCAPLDTLLSGTLTHPRLAKTKSEVLSNWKKSSFGLGSGGESLKFKISQAVGTRTRTGDFFLWKSLT